MNTPSGPWKNLTTRGRKGRRATKLEPAAPAVKKSGLERLVTWLKLRGSITGDRVGGGPSMRTRARVVVAVALVLTLPTLLLGVVRSAPVVEQSRAFARRDAFVQALHRARVASIGVEHHIWRFRAQKQVDNARAVDAAFDKLSASIVTVMQALPKDKDVNDLRGLREAVARGRAAVDRALKAEKADLEQLGLATLALETVSGEIDTLYAGALQESAALRTAAENALSRVGRDQLVLFLLLLILAPLLIVFGPSWVVEPMARLRGLAKRVKNNQHRDIVVSGRDEVAQVGDALKTALKQLKKNDLVKSAWIRLLGRVVQAVLDHVAEPCFVLDRGGIVKDTNDAAARVLGIKAHNLRGQKLEELLFSPELAKALDRAVDGDTEHDGIDVSLETENGTVRTAHVFLEPVKNSSGEIERVVVVMQC